MAISPTIGMRFVLGLLMTSVSFSALAIGDDPTGTNAIPEMRFKAESMEKKVALCWSMNCQKNTDYFILERSVDGLDWKVIDKEKAAENCTIPMYYEFFDENAPSELCYYRIKTKFLDKSEEVSSMSAVDRTNNKEYLTFFPTVAYTHLSIISSNDIQTVAYELKNKKGKVVELSVKETEEKKIEFDITQLPKGEYTLHLKSETGLSVKGKVFLK